MTYICDISKCLCCGIGKSGPRVLEIARNYLKKPWPRPFIYYLLK